MPNQSRKSRSRSRNRDSRPGHSVAHPSDGDPGSRRRKSHSRRTSKRHNSPNNLLIEQMQQILNRLTALEGERRSSPSRPLEPSAGAPALTPPLLRPVTATVAEHQRSLVEGRESTVPSSPERPVSAITDRDASGTDRIIDAIRSINTTVRSNQSYYISNFDPSIHDIDTWCEEVDRAKSTNYWNDNECLSRIGNCLKGDARTWLNEWVTNDRSWSNFKKEFKPLCPRKPDVANILYEVMSNDSDRYPTYADYARRSLLKLRIVRGLSDELISAIVIRGITDPQIRASATNAKLMPNELVEFFSIYVKSNTSTFNKKSSESSRNDRFSKLNHDANVRKRKFEEGKCFFMWPTWSCPVSLF